MRQRNIRLLIGIFILAAIMIWIDQPNNPGLHIKIGDLEINREFTLHQGLDLQGGLQVLLEADVPPRPGSGIRRAYHGSGPGGG